MSRLDELLRSALEKRDRGEKLTDIEERVVAYQIYGFGCPSGSSQLAEYQVRETGDCFLGE